MYVADPPLCPQCGGSMQIVAFSEQLEAIEKILIRLGFVQDARPQLARVHRGIGG